MITITEEMMFGKKYVLSKRISNRIDVTLNFTFADEVFHKLIEVFYDEPTQVDGINLEMMDHIYYDNY